MSKQIYPAEFVFPGHPDKLSDARCRRPFNESRVL